MNEKSRPSLPPAADATVGDAPGATPLRVDHLPDARDGLTRRERIVLHVLNETQRERGGRNVPTAMLWGRVCEIEYISPSELTEILARLGATG